MRKIIGLVAAALMAAVFFVSTAYAQDGGSFPPEFSSANVWGKLDGSMQQAWTDAKKGGDMTVRFDCFVRVEPPFDPGDRAFLESSGMVVQVAAGNIVRGHMKAGDVPNVANQPFVQSVRLSSKK